MINFFILTCLFISNIFAVDATMEIIKKNKVLPVVLVSISTDNINTITAKKIQKIINQDLLVSGHFSIKELDYKKAFNSEPNFITLQNKNIDLFLNIALEKNQLGGLKLNVKLYDINSNKLSFDKSYSTSSKVRHPFLAHKVSISINNYFNAPAIDWMDKFIIFAKYTSAKKSQIIIADYTLTYQKIIIDSGLNIFPKWASKEQESFYYTSYRGGLPELIKKNLYTSKSKRIIKSEGMIVCSDVSENGGKLLLTMAPNSQPDIYLYDVRQGIKTRLTSYKGIDVGGSFVENDSKVIFVSDRLKYPNIFAKKIGSKGVERLVYHGRNNSACTTYKNYIVYSSRETHNEFGRNSFNLYLISTTSDFIRRLTTTGLNQFPKFSTDGETILFIKRYKGKSYLGLTRLNYNKSFIFPLKSGKLQSIDW